MDPCPHPSSQAMSQGGATAVAGVEQLEQLEAAFTRLVDSTADHEVKDTLLFNKDKLVNNEVVSTKALQGLTAEQLMACGLSRAAVAALKLVFPTPTTADQSGKEVTDGTVQAFQTKLAQFMINRPDKAAMQRLILSFPKELALASGKDVEPDVAKALYDRARLLPGTTTRSQIKAELGISLNGPWLESHPNLIIGIDCNQGSVPVVLKLLYTNEVAYQQAAKAELMAVDTLGQPDCSVALVPAQVVKVHVKAEDQQVLGAAQGLLKMPLYAGSLATLPRLTEASIAAGGQRIQAALEFMHEKKLVHMDVKPANILMDYNGRWFLSDYGSTTSVGGTVWSTTPGWYPGDLKGRTAREDIDWAMLLVSLVVLVDKEEWIDTLTDHTGKSIALDKVLARCTSIQDPKLKALLQQLKEDAQL